jgi:hypothetical protein
MGNLGLADWVLTFNEGEIAGGPAIISALSNRTTAETMRLKSPFEAASDFAPQSPARRSQTTPETRSNIPVPVNPTAALQSPAHRV